MLKLIYVLSAITVTSLTLAMAGASPVKADAPVCLDGYGSAGQTRLCNFYTISQCKATSIGIGGSCILNPWYRSSGHRG